MALQDLEESRLTVCWMQCVPPLLILDMPILPLIVIRGICYLDAQRISGGNVDISRCRKQIAVVSAASCRLSIRGEWSYHFQLSLFTGFFPRAAAENRQEHMCVCVCVCVCVRSGVHDSSFDPGVLVVKSCLDWRDCCPQLTVTIRARSQSPSGALKG